MKRCRWCFLDASHRLLIGTDRGRGEIITAWFCKRHFEQFVAEQTAKGNVVAPPVRVDPTGEPTS